MNVEFITEAQIEGGGIVFEFNSQEVMDILSSYNTKMKYTYSKDKLRLEASINMSSLTESCLKYLSEKMGVVIPTKVFKFNEELYTDILESGIVRMTIYGDHGIGIADISQIEGSWERKKRLKEAGSGSLVKYRGRIHMIVGFYKDYCNPSANDLPLLKHYNREGKAITEWQDPANLVLICPPNIHMTNQYLFKEAAKQAILRDLDNMPLEKAFGILSKSAEVIHKDHFGVLYKIQLGSEDFFQAVKVIDSTPQPNSEFKEYFIPVPNNIKRAKEAVAWSFGLKEDEYNPLVET